MQFCIDEPFKQLTNFDQSIAFYRLIFSALSVSEITTHLCSTSKFRCSLCLHDFPAQLKIYTDNYFGFHLQAIYFR